MRIDRKDTQNTKNLGWIAMLLNDEVFGSGTSAVDITPLLGGWRIESITSTPVAPR
jgi:hypothetical protein